MAKSSIPKTPKVCQVEGCSDNVRARGCCNKHYQRLYKLGLPPLPSKYNEKCKVVGCEVKQYTRGYCNRHYRQIKKYDHIVGDPRSTKHGPSDMKIVGNICEITLRDNHRVVICKAIIDVDDYHKVSGIRWHFSDGYVKDTKGQKLHRLIMDTSNDAQAEIDHINHDGLNNRKINLRICSHAQNTYNKILCSTNTSGYKGVVHRKNIGKWEAKIGINGDRKHLGYFDNKYDAAKAYDLAAIENFGEFAATNKELGLL